MNTSIKSNSVTFQFFLSFMKMGLKFNKYTVLIFLVNYVEFVCACETTTLAQ